MRPANRAFTLIEVLVVTAIIALMLAITLPTFSAGKRAARRATSISNLRQMWTALTLYVDEVQAIRLPPGPIAQAVVSKAPTCDPEDYWRLGCSPELGPPLIGSYAYIRYVKPFTNDDDWDEVANVRLNPTVFASVFYASNRMIPMNEMVPTPARCAGRIDECLMPDRVLRLRLDGSIKLTTQKTVFPGGQAMMFSWPVIFAEFESWQ